MRRQSRQESQELLRHADRATDRQRRDGEIRFSSALAAVNWFWEMQLCLSSPQGLHPRTQTAANGAQVYVRVEGGRGGDFDEVLATVTTIGQALEGLERSYPKPYKALLLTARDGLPQKKAADILDVGQATLSAWRGIAEAYLVGALGPDVLAF